MPRLFIGILRDNFILIPTVVFSLGRCPTSGKVAGCQLLIAWLNTEVGLELDFFQ